MCAIIDNNVVHQAFGRKTTTPGKRFREWVEAGSLRLVVGGKLLVELKDNKEFREWLGRAIEFGKARMISSSDVDAQTEQLLQTDACVSDDEHVVALAQISGARLLYTNEPDLHEDFDNRKLINRPRGRIYTTKDSQDRLTTAHRSLLSRNDLCKAPSDR